MQYKDVVKAMFAKYKGQMPAKDIMKMAAAEYRKMGGAAAAPKARKGKMARGGGVIGDVASPIVGLADSLGSLFGFGLDVEGKGMKKGRKRMPRGGYLSAGAMSAGDMGMEQAMTPGKGAFAQVPFNPAALPNATGGNILQSVSHLLPMMALL
jgi:hypothetical protein